MKKLLCTTSVKNDEGVLYFKKGTYYPIMSRNYNNITTIDERGEEHLVMGDFTNKHFLITEGKKSPYIALIEEIENRVDKAIANNQYEIVEELNYLLKWTKANL